MPTIPGASAAAGPRRLRLQDVLCPFLVSKERFDFGVRGHHIDTRGGNERLFQINSLLGCHQRLNMMSGVGNTLNNLNATHPDSRLRSGNAAPVQ